MTCDHCGTPLTEAQVRRGAKFCSDRCRKAAYRRRQAEARSACFRREYEAHYGPMPEAPVGDREEVHRLLMTAARMGSVTAAKILLDELPRDGGDQPTDFIDELTRRRTKNRSS